MYKRPPDPRHNLPESPFTSTGPPASRARASSHPSSNSSACSDGCTMLPAILPLFLVRSSPRHMSTTLGTSLCRNQYQMLHPRPRHTHLGAYVRAKSAASGARLVFTSRSTHDLASPSWNSVANAKLFAPFCSAVAASFCRPSRSPVESRSSISALKSPAFSNASRARSNRHTVRARSPIAFHFVSDSGSKTERAILTAVSRSSSCSERSNLWSGSVVTCRASSLRSEERAAESWTLICNKNHAYLDPPGTEQLCLTAPWVK
jgi:hypothetical protein